MTIYQFRKELQRLDLAIDYKIYKTAEMSGMVEFKNLFLIGVHILILKLTIHQY